MLRHINNRFMGIIASIFVFFTIIVTMSNITVAEDVPFEAKEFPNIQFKNEQGQTVSLSDYRGKVVLLNFWATWCAPCIREMPDLDDLQGELGEDKFKVIALSQDGKFPDAEKFYRDNNIKNLEIFHDPASKVFFQLGIRGLPHSIIIDQRGNEAASIKGFVDWSSGTRLIIDGLLTKG